MMCLSWKPFFAGRRPEARASAAELMPAKHRICSTGTHAYGGIGMPAVQNAASANAVQYTASDFPGP